MPNLIRVKYGVRADQRAWLQEMADAKDEGNESRFLRRLIDAAKKSYDERKKKKAA